MAKQKKPKGPSKKQSKSNEKTIRILFQTQGDERSKIIVAAGASNYYTSAAYSSDTCCSCESS